MLVLYLKFLSVCYPYLCCFRTNNISNSFSKK